jgi:hypothetical protein
MVRRAVIWRALAGFEAGFYRSRLTCVCWWFCFFRAKREEEVDGEGGRLTTANPVTTITIKTSNRVINMLVTRMSSSS